MQLDVKWFFSVELGPASRKAALEARPLGPSWRAQIETQICILPALLMLLLDCRDEERAILSKFVVPLATQKIALRRPASQLAAL